jgi:hypothetical protein
MLSHLCQEANLLAISLNSEHNIFFLSFRDRFECLQFHQNTGSGLRINANYLIVFFSTRPPVEFLDVSGNINKHLPGVLGSTYIQLAFLTPGF